MSGIFPTPTVRTPFSASRSSTVPFGGGCEKSRRSYVRLNLPRPSPTKGRAMTRASPYSLPTVRAASHQEYSVCRGTFCSCAATWNTLSALVYTMGSPVRRCSSPSSSRITVPLAVLFPRYPGAPERRNHASIRAGGNPRGKVVKPFCSRTPIISQCPVVVSLPWDCSDMRPNAARGESVGGQPAMAVMFPRPHDWRFGTRRPPTLRAQFPSVFAPASPYAFASGSSPAPQESITMATKRPISVRSADYRHAGTRAQAIRSRLEHLARICGGAHATARLHAEVLADDLPHQRDVLGSRAARAKSGAGLHERRSGCLRQGAADHLLVAIESAGLQDHLHEARPGRSHDRPDVAFDVRIVLRLQPADMDHHVDLGSARGDRLARLGNLGFGRLGSGREADYRDGPGAAALDETGAERHVVRGDTHGGEAVCPSLVAELHQLLAGRAGLQERVIDVRSQFPVAPDGNPIGHRGIPL